MGSIYCIENKINGKKYIGKTEYSNPIRRWKKHIDDSKKDKNKNRPLYMALNKYGVENFEFKVLYTGDNLCEKEIEYIQLYETYKNGYNGTLGGDGKSYLNLDNKKIIFDYSINNYSITKIAKTLNCSIGTITNILQLNNIPIVRYRKQNSKKIKNVTLCIEFNSIMDAARYLINNNLTSCKNTRRVSISIWRALIKYRKTYLKYIWEYL